MPKAHNTSYYGKCFSNSSIRYLLHQWVVVAPRQGLPHGQSWSPLPIGLGRPHVSLQPCVIHLQSCRSNVILTIVANKPVMFNHHTCVIYQGCKGVEFVSIKRTLDLHIIDQYSSPWNIFNACMKSTTCWIMCKLNEGIRKVQHGHQARLCSSKVSSCYGMCSKRPLHIQI